MIPLSVLDLITVREGGSVTEALHDAAALAQTAEAAGYKRFWVAEHHAMDGVAGGAAWSSLERDKLSNWFATTRTRCRDALIGMGRRFLSSQKSDRDDQPGN